LLSHHGGPAAAPGRENSRASSTHSTVVALASRARQGSIADPVHSRDRLFDRAEASEYILPVETVGGRESVSLSRSMLERQRMAGRDDEPRRNRSSTLSRSVVVSSAHSPPPAGTGAAATTGTHHTPSMGALPSSSSAQSPAMGAANSPPTFAAIPPLLPGADESSSSLPRRAGASPSGTVMQINIGGGIGDSGGDDGAGGSNNGNAGNASGDVHLGARPAAQSSGSGTQSPQNLLSPIMGVAADPEPLLQRRRSAMALNTLGGGGGGGGGADSGAGGDNDTFSVRSGGALSVLSRGSRSGSQRPGAAGLSRQRTSSSSAPASSSRIASFAGPRLMSMRTLLRSAKWTLVLPLLPVCLFVLMVILDVTVTGSTTWALVRASLWPTDPVKGNSTLVSIAEALAMHLRIATMISLVSVQISAERFTPLVAQLFFGHRAIRTTLSLFAGTVCYVLGVKYFTTPLLSPTFSATLAVILAAVCYGAIVPYFVFVLTFLQPETVIDHVVAGMCDDAVGGAGGDNMIPESELDRRERALTLGMERLADLALKALHYSDRIVAAKACHAFGEFVTQYASRKSRLPDAWFLFPPHRTHTSDFINLSASAVQRIEQRKTWVEYKVLKLFQVL
jgi:hypothetical protein